MPSGSVKDEPPVAGVVVEGVVSGVCVDGVVVDGVVVEGVVVDGVVVAGVRRRAGVVVVAGVFVPAAQEQQRDHDHDAEHGRDHEPGDETPPLDDRTVSLGGIDRSRRPPARVADDSANVVAGRRRVALLGLLSRVLAPVVLRDVTQPIVG